MIYKFLPHFSQLVLIASILTALGYSFENFSEEGLEENKKEFEYDDFTLDGPDILCLYYGSIIGDFFGGGLPSDVFRWQIFDADGNQVIQREGAFQKFSFTFSNEGIFKVVLNVRRGANLVFSAEKEVEILGAPELILQNTYFLCEAGQTSMTLVAPEEYLPENISIEWLDPEGQSLGIGNTVTVDKPGIYTVNFFQVNDNVEFCPFSLTTNVIDPSEFNVDISQEEACDGFTEIFLDAGEGIFGTWFYSKKDEEERVLLSSDASTIFYPFDLDGPGEYELIFEVETIGGEFCEIEKTLNFTVLPQAEIELEVLSNVTGCNQEDGEILIKANSRIDRLDLRKGLDNIITFFDLQEGDERIVSNLEPGIYAIRTFLDGCSTWYPFTIETDDLPDEMGFEIIEVIPETCTETGKLDGKVRVKLNDPGFLGEFQLFDVNGLPSTLAGAVIEADEDGVFEFSVRAGRYYIEIIRDDGCKNASQEEIRIFFKGQVDFSVPNILTVCEFFDFLPNSSQPLIYELTFPNGETQLSDSGDTFRLEQEGIYRIVGIDPNDEDGFCPRERSFRVVLIEPIEYEPVLVEEDCFGNKKYEVQFSIPVDLSQVDIRWINESGEVVGRGNFLFPTTFGEFTLEVQPIGSQACPTPPKTFQVRRPDFQLEISHTADFICPGNPVSKIEVQTDFDEVDRISWLFYEGETGVELPEFEGLSEVEVTRAGAYEVVLFSEFGCEIGRKLILVEESDRDAEFDVPNQIIICEFFDLIPETQLDLIFTITDPNGQTFTIASGDSFQLTLEGEYIFEAKAGEEEDQLCPVIKTLEVIFTRSIDFQPELFQEDCSGDKVYRANIFEEDPNSVDFFWYDSSMNRIGDQQLFLPVTFGEFFLEVRPKGSQSCPEQAVSFFVEAPILSVPLTLTGEVICPDPGFTFLVVETPMEQVDRLIWYYTDSGGLRTEISRFENETSIAVSEEGMYEVKALNSIGCVLASESVMIQISTDPSRPVTEEQYLVCPFYGKGEEIDPGDFDQYFWMLDDEVVFDQRFFSPEKSGTYTLEVISIEGCSYFTSFEVVENCVLQVVYPNAMQPSESGKHFEIYANELVDEVQVWIYNKWGQLLFYCSNPNAADSGAFCKWDGTYNGEKLAPGMYVLKIQYRNRSDESYQQLTDGILLID